MGWGMQGSGLRSRCKHSKNSITQQLNLQSVNTKMSIKPLHIVIITYAWPPQNCIATHRPYSWALNWSKSGASITVLTAQKTQFDEPLDLFYPEIEGVKVIQTQYNNVLKIKWSIFKNSLANKILKKVRIFLWRIGVKPPTAREAWGQSAIEAAIALAKDADIVVSTFGPDETHWLANEMKEENPKLIWVADYRDLWSQNLAWNKLEYLSNALQKVELATVGKNSDLITTVSQDLQRKLCELHSRNVLYTPNGFEFDEQEVQALLSKKPSITKGSIRVIYTGNISLGQLQNPRPILNALASLSREGKIKPGSITIDFYEPHTEVSKSLSTIKEFRPFIKIKEHIPREKALKVQRQADVLLIFGSDDPEGRGVVTGKLFEYIASGRPILCVGGDPDYEMWQILEKTGTGRAIESSNLEALKQLLLDTLDGNGLYDFYAPKIDEILIYSRGRIANKMFNDMVNVYESRQ